MTSGAFSGEKTETVIKNGKHWHLEIWLADEPYTSGGEPACWALGTIVSTSGMVPVSFDDVSS